MYLFYQPPGGNRILQKQGRLTKKTTEVLTKWVDRGGQIHFLAPKTINDHQAHIDYV